MTVKTWLISLCILFLLGIGTLFGINQIISDRLFDTVTMPQLLDALRQKYEYGLKNVVDVEAQNLAERLKGVTDKREQRALVEQFTDYQRFFPNDEGYYFTYDLAGTRINVPINKSLNGKDCSDLKDTKGMAFVREFIARAKNGGGFVEYYFEKPGAGEQPKLSYVRLIPGTDILIGTGVYIDGVQIEQQRIRDMVAQSNTSFAKYQLWASLAMIVLILAAARYIAGVICHPLLQITATAQEVAEGRLNAATSLNPRCPREMRTLHAALSVMMNALRSRIDEAAQKTREAVAAVEEARIAQSEAEAARKQAESAKQEGMLAAANQLEEVTAVISSASTELSAQIEQSDRGAAASSQRLSEAATAMNEMNATVQEVARNASSAASASAETKDKAEAGARVVKQAVQSIEQVHRLSLNLKEDMTQLNGHAQNITRIMNVISDIADQTNLLALNAAIEAARAGDAGRGFAVVADEVRKLAEKTMASTTDVSNAIGAIQTSTTKSMDAVDHAVRQIEQATSLASQSGQALGDIVTKVDATAVQVSSIATASEEQSAASDEINQTIVQVDDMSRQTASAMGEAAKAVSELAAQAQQLAHLIREMKRG